MKPLVVPPAAQRDEDAVQMLSAWIAEKGLHCALNVGMWSADGHNEPAAWGILLADVVRHLANAIELEAGADHSETIAEIVDSLLSEIDSPTSVAKGDFHSGHS
jgi:hypothetical protein